MAVIRNDLNGVRVQKPGHAEVYLIVNGCRQHIPNIPTYNKLFPNWDGIISDINIDDIQDAGPLSDQAVLIKSDNVNTVYLATNGKKLGIPSPEVFDEHYFDWGKIQVLPAVAVDAIPDGEAINGR